MAEATDRIEAAIDRLDNFISSLVNLTMLPNSIHVSALREGLPSVSKDLRAALADLPQTTGEGKT